MNTDTDNEDVVIKVKHKSEKELINISSISQSTECVLTQNNEQPESEENFDKYKMLEELDVFIHINY